MNESAVLVIIGQRLKYFREKRMLTQRQLSPLVKMDIAFISKIENGNHNLTVKTLHRFCVALEISMDTIFIEQPINQ